MYIASVWTPGGLITRSGLLPGALRQRVQPQQLVLRRAARRHLSGELGARRGRLRKRSSQHRRLRSGVKTRQHGRI